MINENFVFLGLALTLFGGLDYIIATIKGKVQPNRVSWFLWGTAAMIAFAAEIKQEVGLPSVMTFAVGLNPLLVFLASFVNKKSVWKLGRFDFICGALSFLGLILWFFTKVGDIAIFFSIAADGLAAVPTIVKAYSCPKTETDKVYLFGFLNAGVTLLTIKNWNFATYGFPIYMFLVDILVFCLVKFEMGSVINKLIRPPKR